MSNKDFRQFIRGLEAAGATFEVRRNGHGLITLPNGYRYFCARTPSDPRTQKNILATLRRNGLDDLSHPGGTN